MVLQLDFYIRFRAKHEVCEVSLCLFEKFKPYYIRRLKERNTCACIYHCEMVGLRYGFNNMRTSTKGIHGSHCSCTCEICLAPVYLERNQGPHGSCCADLTHVTGLTDFWHSVLCPIEDDGWHHPHCLRGKCDQCGVENALMLCPLEESELSGLQMEWKCYENITHGKTRNGNDKKVLRL